MDRAVLGFLSGAGRREEKIRRAIRSVERLPATTVIAQSGHYGAEPQAAAQSEPGCAVACAVVLTGMSPSALAGACKGIAAAVGGDTDAADSAPALEISLLVYEGTSRRDGELTLPNTELLRRPAIRRAVADIFRDGRVLDFDFPRSEKRTAVAP